MARRAASPDPLVTALFEPMGSPGVYARRGPYEEVVEGLTRLITRARDPDAEVLRFPPVMSRRQLETSGYLKSFPNLLGCVCCLDGSETEIRRAADRLANHDARPWTADLEPADLVLTPASCYPLYPIVAARGRLASAGAIFDVGCECFRREPSDDLDRLQSFRMREIVRIGSPEQIHDFREDWIGRATGIAERLGLTFVVETANDPFFGRAGQLMAISQREQALKFELLIPVISAERPTACMSFNSHRDHFGEIWNLRTASGEMAHTGCVAFGVDRLAVALFATHGPRLEDWPSQIAAQVLV